MPQSRKRPGHTYQKPSDIPASQRTKGRITWAILLAVLGGIMMFFATSGDYTYSLIGAALSGLGGYFIGRKMEREATGK